MGHLALLILLAQDLPDSPAKPTVQRICATCHTLGVVVSKRRAKSDWQKSVQDMAGRGMKATDEEMEAAVEYFTHYFGKININRADAAEIQSIADLTAKEAAAVVKYREENGEFKSFDGLSKVPGLDAKKLDERRDRIVFR
jgi:competence protein ComEA